MDAIQPYFPPRPWFLLAIALWISGCAGTDVVPDARDPWQGYNRSMQRFNDALDRTVMRPVAETYTQVLPSPVRTGVTNFFSNLDDVTVVLNDLGQLKLAQGGFDLARLCVNTGVGLGGIFDVATPLNLTKHNEDFGQTLGYWGVGTGPYLVLPLLGPSDLRDGLGLLVDLRTDPLFYEDQDNISYPLVTLRAVDTRASLLGASRVLEQAALDPYAFMRDSYLQHRENLVYDGNPPLPDFGDFDLPPADAPPP